MTIKSEKLTLRGIEDMCKLAHEHKVTIEVTVRPEDYEVNISPWVRTKSTTMVETDDPPVIIGSVSEEDLEKIRSDLKQKTHPVEVTP